MEVRLFELSNTQASIRRIGLTNLATGHYSDSKYEPGKFELSMPSAAPFALEFTEDRLVLIDRWYWGVITGRSLGEGADNLITIAGSQLTDWLHRRQIVPPVAVEGDAPRGYDSCSGSTEYIMKQAVRRHIGDQAAEARQVFGLTVAENFDRGNPDDAYLYRYAYLDEALIEIGKRENMGIKITGDELRCRFTFDVIPRRDRTINQTINNPLVLQMSRHNMESLDYTQDASPGRNVFYCTRSDSAEVWEKFTQTYYSTEEEPTGYRRRECGLSVSVPESENPYTAMEEASRKEMEGYKPTESASCVMSRRLEFRKDYQIGDYCTLQAEALDVLQDMEIVAVDTVVSETSTNYVATFGESKPTRFDKIQKETRERYG